MNRYLALLGCIAAGFILFYASVRTPAPAPASAPASAFSASRAMADVTAMAPVPHPIGSPENHKVRDYLVQRMTALGLAPRIQRTVSVNPEIGPVGSFVAAAPVENVIGVLAGRDPALPALALTAHYDSVPGSPGAADDIASVSTILEIMRALKTGGTPARDVVVVFTDGEEAGLLGAQAFFHADPLAHHVGYDLNLDNRGGGGRAMMFETSANNGGDIALLQRAARRPSSHSLAVFVYKHEPNDTDFTVARKAGVPGLNYAYFGRQFDYHSPSSTIAALDQGAVQHVGDQVLPTVRALAFSRDLPARAPDAAYGDLLGLTVIAYPAWGGWIVLAIAGGLIAGSTAFARRDKLASLGGAAQGFGAGLLILIGAALVLHLARRVTGVEPGWISYRPLLARFPPFEVGMAFAGLSVVLLTPAALARGRARLAAAGLALVLGLLGSAFGGFDVLGLGLGVAAAVLAALTLGAPAERVGSWIGLLAGAWLATLAVQIAAPTISPATAWPLTLAAAVAALTAAGDSRRAWAWALVGVLTVLALAWLGVLFHSLLEALDVPEAPALAVWLAALVLWPLAWPDAPESRWNFAPGATALVLGLAVMAALHLTSPWTARHPRAVEPQYLVDAGTGRAWRIAAIPPDAWTKGVLKTDGGAITEHSFAPLPRPVMAAPARAVSAPPPTISLQRAPDGITTLRVTPAPGANRIFLDLRADAPIVDATVAGQPAAILRRRGQHSRILWEGSDQPFAVTFRPLRNGALDLAYAQQFGRWPSEAKPLPPLPAIDMAWDEAGATLVVGRQHTAW